MSAALERVIAEQQKTIDSLKAREASRYEVSALDYKRREALFEAIFSYMNYPAAPHSRTNLLMAITNNGYCITCEQSPCECQDE